MIIIILIMIIIIIMMMIIIMLMIMIVPLTAFNLRARPGVNHTLIFGRASHSQKQLARGTSCFSCIPTNSLACFTVKNTLVVFDVDVHPF